jgi:hypothetical protein
MAGGGVTSGEENESDKIFRRVGEFGPFQLVIVILISVTCVIPSIVQYGIVFYNGVPEFRCKLPMIENDTYEVSTTSNDSFSAFHRELIDVFIPLDKENADKFDKCQLKVFSNDSNPTVNTTGFVLEKCKEYVYSDKYFKETLATRVIFCLFTFHFNINQNQKLKLQWNLVCDKTSSKSLIQTLFFVGQYLVFIIGILSDKYGRQKTAFYCIVINGIANVAITVLLNIKSLSEDTEYIAFIVLRMITGLTANTYTVVMILAIEMCGTNKRVAAGNIIYYLYIFGELLTVCLAYFFRDYDSLIITYTVIFVPIIFYFWYMNSLNSIVYI